MRNKPREDISCFCGGDLVKGRTVAWDCGSCGEQWWPHLWDKLQKTNNIIDKKDKIIDIKSLNWQLLKQWIDDNIQEIPVKWLLEKMDRLEELNGKTPGEENG